MSLLDWFAGSNPQAMAGTAAAAAVGSIFGNVDKIIRDFKLPPEQELAFRQKLFELQLQEAAQANQSVEGARQMQTATRSWAPPLLALFTTLGFFGLLSYLLIHAVPPENKDILNIMLGSLGTAWIMVMTFYFGDSHGSQTKTAIIGDIAKS